MDKVTAVVLAAGRGTRMKAKNKNKVAYKIAGKPMISHTVTNLKKAGIKDIVVVVGHMADSVKDALGDTVTYATQKEALGTGDAIKTALPHLKKNSTAVISVYGDDSAFYPPELYQRTWQAFQDEKADLVFLTVIKDDPTGLGRVVRGDKGQVLRIVEEKNATLEERQIKEINTGFYCFNKEFLESSIGKVRKNPVSGEYYITDLVEAAIDSGKKVVTVTLDNPSLWHGVNTKADFLKAQTLGKKLGGVQKVHFVGIKGVGMTALALIYKGMGHRVTGSDSGESYVTDAALRQNGVRCFRGFDPKHVTSDLDLVIYSPAYNPNKNPELSNARELGVVMKTQSEVLGDLSRQKQTIAVCGVGGKTTVTAMIAHILEDAGLEPSYAIGGVVDGKNPGAWRKGDYFIVEADEYANIAGIDLTPKLLLLDPAHIVATNISFDHPDVYKNVAETKSTFARFFTKLPKTGKLYFNLDDVLSQELSSAVPKTNKVSFGVDAHSDWQLLSVSAKGQRTLVTLVVKGETKELDLLVFGVHNAKNALVAAAVASDLGVPWSKIRKAMGTFTGVKRRQEYKGQLGQSFFYDDYAHHPSEIIATIKSMRDHYPDSKIWVIFQPHTYSRTQALFKDFVTALSQADKVSLMPIFASARENKSEFTIESDDIVAALQKLGIDADLLTFDTAPAALRQLSALYTCVLTMGAGDVYELHAKIGSRI